MKPQGSVLCVNSAPQACLSPLDEIVRNGARRMLQAAIDAEVAEDITRCREFRDDEGHRLVVRNGTLPERTIATGAGMIAIKQPRVYDRRADYNGPRKLDQRSCKSQGVAWATNRDNPSCPKDIPSTPA